MNGLSNKMGENCSAALQMLGRGLRSVLLHLSRPMTAKRAQSETARQMWCSWTVIRGEE